MGTFGSLSHRIRRLAHAALHLVELATGTNCSVGDRGKELALAPSSYLLAKPCKRVLTVVPPFSGVDDDLQQRRWSKQVAEGELESRSN